VTQLARRLLSVSEVADATGLSSNAIYRAISDGQLRASKLRGRLRIELADLEAWIDSNLVTTRGKPKTPPLRPVHEGETCRAGGCSSCSKTSIRRANGPADSGHALSHSERR
jgi:excisionase family DNA binding protein